MGSGWAEAEASLSILAAGCDEEDSQGVWYLVTHEGLTRPLQTDGTPTEHERAVTANCDDGARREGRSGRSCRS